MAIYAYKAKDVSGKPQSGTVEAENVKTAAAKLQSMGLYPVSIEAATSKKGLGRFFSFKLNSIPRQDVALFTCRLSDLLRGGLPLVKALTVLVRQTENRALQKTIGEIKDAVQDGKTFSSALSAYPKLFSNLYLGIVKAGESAGMLESVLSRLAEFDEQEELLRHRVKAALAYPVLMFMVGLASIIFLLAFVIPKFEAMFMDMGQLLPLPTRVLISASSIIQHWWWLYIPALTAGLLYFDKYRKSVNGGRKIDRIKLALPLAGELMKKELVSRFVRMLGALLKNGVPILDALAMVKDSVGNEVFAAEIDEVYRSVKEGEGLVEPLRNSRYFPPIVADMVAIGEETGNLENSLARIAETYDREVEYSVKTLTSLIEPVIILVVGLMVGFVALSMLLPIFQISASIR